MKLNAESVWVNTHAAQQMFFTTNRVEAGKEFFLQRAGALAYEGILVGLQSKFAALRQYQSLLVGLSLTQFLIHTLKIARMFPALVLNRAYFLAQAGLLLT